MKVGRWVAQHVGRRLRIDIQRSRPKHTHVDDLSSFPELVLREWSFGDYDHEARRTAHDFVDEVRPEPPHTSWIKEIPKVIWVYWGQGWASAPPIVRTCRGHIERWAEGFTVHFLDSDSLSEFADIPATVSVSLQGNETTFSDVARCDLLAAHGGIWLDATCMPTQSMNRLHDFARGEFLSYTRRDGLISTWMMASPAGHIIPTMLRDIQIAWWTRKRDLPAYYWIHYLFEALMNRIPEFRQAWDSRSALFGEGQNLLGELLPEPYAASVMAAIANSTFIQKLTHKGDTILRPTPGSFAEFILAGGTHNR